jgi:potassium-dependent mechanosensitive channel
MPALVQLTRSPDWTRVGLSVGQFAIWMLLLSLPCQAQMPIRVPDLPGLNRTESAKQKAPTSEQPTPETAMAELRKKLSAAEAELNEVSASGALGKGAPLEVPHNELVERRSLLQKLVRAYGRQIEDSEKLEQARQRRRKVERASSEWKGFPTPPPYSILMVDDLRDSAQSVRRAVDNAQARLALTERMAQRNKALLNTTDERLRQASEELESARDPVRAAGLAWKRDLWRLRNRVAAATATMTEMARKQDEEELAETRQQLAFIERQLAVGVQQFEFTQQDLDKILKQLESEKQSLEAEIDRMIGEEFTRRRALEGAERRLLDVRNRPGQPSGTTAARTMRLEETVEAKRLELDNLNLQLDVLRLMVEGTERQHRLWVARFSSLNVHDPVAARDAYLNLEPSLQLVQGWRQYIHQQIDIVSGQISQQERRVKDAAPGSDLTQLRDILQAYRQRESIYRRALLHTDRLVRFLERWKSEFEGQRAVMPVSARMQEWIGITWASVLQMWNFELFAAEDTIEVDGQQITGRRSVTVGKTVRALAILLFGYWAGVILARLAQRLAVTRYGMDPNLANILRQWMMVLLVAILLTFSLTWVKIPLTIFAFLGGALAIGIGFGTQNLLKNFMSGILLLIERPIRVGDLIEIDGVRGRVTGIGFRSSTIRDGNGMELFVPNSNLLERNLSNWTYSSRKTRFSLEVGVAYGSPTGRVRELLAEAAERHGLVLKDPGPQVLFTDFGDNALKFTLQYWLEVTPDTDAALVASDLRYIIEKHFAEAGIIFAFPQRDVHLNTSQPIQVQVRRDTQDDAHSRVAEEREPKEWEGRS